ncbi:MAG: thioredoxin family protein [Planctomycetes bacterium]|nr:thioredoxin family protein [Planctomycetota bacterium]
MKVSMTLAFVVLVAAVLAPAQEGIKWEKDLASALARAKAEKRPLLISMHTSTEVACQRMLTKIYADPEVQARLAEFVLLPTCFDKHAEEKAVIDGVETMVSPLFKTVGCDALTRNEQEVREHFFDKAEVKVPQHVFVDADGNMYLNKIYELKKKEFLALLNRGLVMFGGKASEAFEEATRKLFEDVKKGSAEEKEAAVKAIVELGDPEKLDVLYLTIIGLEKDDDQAVCIRALGYEQYAAAADFILKFLDADSDYIKNCAVITLEEMKASQADAKLRALLDKARDKHLKKDILRALGPAGGSDEAKAVLLEYAEDREDDFRVASYLSLGNYMSDTKVQEFLPQRYKKEGKDVAAKTAIIWAYATSRDESLIPALQEMVSKEKNKQMEDTAGLAMERMKQGNGPPPPGQGDGRGQFMRVRKALAPLFAKDKIDRNRVKEWKKWGGGGGR